jgi:CRP-like cAMP-binding protein
MFNLDGLVNRLANVPHFKGLPESAIKAIVFAGQVGNYKTGDHLFHEGAPCAGLHVILKGHVHLYKYGVHGQETIIASIKPVIMFNEVPTLDGGVNPVSAIAVQDCVTWCICHDRFQVLMRTYPELGTSLLKILAARNRLLFTRYEDLLSRPVIARVAKVLIELSSEGSDPIDRYKYDNQKLAALAATVPEAVSRSVKTLKDEGMISASRSKIVLLALDELYEAALIEPLSSLRG